MSKKENGEELAKLGKTLNIRVTPQLNKLVSCRAMEDNCTESEIVREALYEYFERRLSVSEAINLSIQDLNKTVKYQDDKIELMGLMILNIARTVKERLPAGRTVNKELIDQEMREFENDCLKSLKQFHNGKLEQMVLNIYEQMENED